MIRMIQEKQFNWSVEQKKIMDHFDNFLIQIPVKSGHHAAPFHQLVLADYSLNHWNNRTSKIGYLLLQEKSYFFSKEDLRQWYFLPKRRFIASEEANIFHFQKKIPWFFFTKGDTWMVILQLSGYYIQLAENDLTLRKMTTKPSIIIWSILPKDVPVTCKSVFFTSCKIIKMVHYLLLLNTPAMLKSN